MFRILRRPAFKSGHSEQSHHSHEDVVKVEVAVMPQAFVNGWLVYISILVQDVGAPMKKSCMDVKTETRKTI